MTTEAGKAARREVCGACHRPKLTCLCRWVIPVACTTKVLILQHPLEVHHAKNTARLLHLSLLGSQVRVGEQFAAADLQAALAGPAVNVLLYPQGEQPAAPLPAWAPSLHAPDTPVRLVVLDATWRKSRKMLHLNPLLQCLPRLSLDATQLSRYLIRKAHKPGQLSTLEATCAALAQMEGNGARYQPLLDALDGFVTQRLAFQLKSL
jgi:DTW domain-containing protein YfiP